MAVNEIALLTLAWNLAVAPSASDIQNFQSLNQEDQIKIQSLIEQKDILPLEIEKLKELGIPQDVQMSRRAPTTETSR